MQENHRDIYSYMLLSETLWKHLAEIDEESNEMMDRLVERMAKREGVTEQLRGNIVPLALKSQWRYFEKIKIGIDRTEELACSFLFLLPEHHTDISCHFRHG